MIFLVLIIFVIVLIYSPKDEYLNSFKPMIHKILIKSNPDILKLVYKNQKSLNHLQIRNSKQKTYTLDKQIIYIVTQRPNSQKYKKDTILFVLLHEVAHILSPDEHHTPRFFEIEKKLHRKAIELGVLNLGQVEKDYPCTH